MKTFLRSTIPVLLALLIGVFSADAQGAGRLILFDVDSSAFPRITARLRVFDPQGAFRHNFTPAEIRLLEDERTVAIESLNEQRVGTQFVLAINSGASFAIRDSTGVTRFEHALQALTDWMTSSAGEEADDLSLTTNQNFESLHLTRRQDLHSALQAFTPNPEATVPGLEVLTRALAIATEPTPRQGMGRSVLLITAPPNQASLAALPSLSALAEQNHIRVSIWVIGSRVLTQSETITQLSSFAAQTGGDLFLFSGEEELPPVDAYLEPLRYFYELTYTSRINSGGEHLLFASLANEPEVAIPSPLTLSLEVQPPNPIFISPPLEITRQEDDEGRFSPDIIPLELIIEFTDGHPRDLARTTLYVNGQPVAQNTTPPFDRFAWDVSNILSEGEFTLRVEAEDSLGLKSSTIEHRVRLHIQRAPVRLSRILQQNLPLAIGVALAVAGSLVLLILLLSGRLLPAPRGVLTKPENSTDASDEKEAAPSPSLPQRAGRQFVRWATRFTRHPTHPVQIEADALLEPLHNQGEPIQIWRRELTIGSDPNKAAILLKDPSVDALHARLEEDENGTVRVFDLDSLAGTWLNYQRLPPEGAALSHGDILHFGRAAFRFKWRAEERIPRIRITPLPQPDQPLLAQEEA